MSYSPKIKPELVRRLYQLKHSTVPKKPITRLANEAIEIFLNQLSLKEEKEFSNGSKLS
jgi:hypothetical protein